MDIQDLDEVISVESSYPGALGRKVCSLKRCGSFCRLLCHEIEDRPRQRVIGFICFRSVAEESELLNICVHSIQANWVPAGG